MTSHDESFLNLEQEPAVPFRVTPGFLAFVAFACLPALIAVGVFFGAWAVAGEVEAAERNAAAGAQVEGVDAWKKTLVGICPVH